ncbi:MAG: hypothetical protein WC489_01850 [Patescibacteria group bacterium]
MKKMVAAIYSIILIFLCLYSYVLIDPNITFVQHPFWVRFREFVIEVGYYRRDISWILYFGILLLLYLFHFYFIKNHQKIRILQLVGIISVIFIFSYPFFSHDFFNYMFDARIFTWYGKNPYLYKALDFPADQWTRFMHWTHRTYPYGPFFLLLSFIPSFFGFGKFTITFVLFKIMFIGFYVLSVFFLQKLNKKWAVLYATHPFIIVEGLVNGHNDLIGLCLAIIGIYYILKKKNAMGRVILLLSIGIKYINLPVSLVRNAKTFVLVSFVLQCAILVYISFRMEIQPWYFLSLFAYLPFFPNFISRLNLFFFGLLVSYYPYIRLGGWDRVERVNIKHQIIGFFALCTFLQLGFLYSLRYIRLRKE